MNLKQKDEIITITNGHDEHLIIKIMFVQIKYKVY